MLKFKNNNKKNGKKTPCSDAKCRVCPYSLDINRDGYTDPYDCPNYGNYYCPFSGISVINRHYQDDHISCSQERYGNSYYRL